MPCVFLIDFDGTLCDHVYPDIGKEVPHAFDVLRELKKAGHVLILWTMRSGRTLEDAVAWCASRDTVFDYVNDAPPRQATWTSSRKVLGKLIDDNAIGCPLYKPRGMNFDVVDWCKVRQILVDTRVLEETPR